MNADIVMGLRGHPGCSGAVRGYGGTTNFYQTINTHDRESELTREAENLLTGGEKHEQFITIVTYASGANSITFLSKHGSALWVTSITGASGNDVAVE